MWGRWPIDATHIKAHRSAGGAKGASRAVGRTSKLHGLTDAFGRPRVLPISTCNINNMSMVVALIEATTGHFDKLIADKGYDINATPRRHRRAGCRSGDPLHHHPARAIPYDAIPTAPATSSNASGAASRTERASPYDTTNSPETISPAPSSRNHHLPIQLRLDPR